MNNGEQQIEIHLEELGQHSWVKAILNTLSGTYGSAQYRFVARAAGADDSRHHVAEGATFPHLRMDDLDDADPTGRDPWLPIARQRLEELDALLTAQGWHRTGEVAPHWWSRRYERQARRPGPQPMSGAAVSNVGGRAS